MQELKVWRSVRVFALFSWQVENAKLIYIYIYGNSHLYDLPFYFLYFLNIYNFDNFYNLGWELLLQLEISNIHKPGKFYNV